MKQTLTINRNVSVTKIALTGAMRSGKDTVSDILRGYYSFSRFAFGDALKRTAHEVFPWISTESKPRKLYQQYGQLMREIDPQVWVRHTERAIESHIEMESGMFGATDIGVVITDVRQENEVAWCRANGFTLIRVTAPQDVRIARAIEAGDDFTVHDLAHSTELALEDFEVDYLVANEGNVDDLKAQIDAIMSQINAVE